MIQEVTIDDDAYSSHGSDFLQVNIGDTVDGMFGYSELSISSDDILHLIRGGLLYHNDGEYAEVISLSTRRDNG